MGIDPDLRFFSFFFFFINFNPREEPGVFFLCFFSQVFRNFPQSFSAPPTPLGRFFEFLIFLLKPLPLGRFFRWNTPLEVDFFFLTKKSSENARAGVHKNDPHFFLTRQIFGSSQGARVNFNFFRKIGLEAVFVLRVTVSCKNSAAVTKPTKNPPATPRDHYLGHWRALEDIVLYPLL